MKKYVLSGAAVAAEQPFNSNFGQPLLQAVRDGTISITVLNTMVDRILTEMFRFNLLSNPRTGSTGNPVTTPAHVAVGNQVATGGTTLLKNGGPVLPLKATNGGSIAVIGPAASASPSYTGGGSAYVTAVSETSPLQGITAAAGSGTTVSYTQGLPADTASGHETLHGVKFSLRVPQGWTATPVGSPVFATVTPHEAPVVTFDVTVPSWAPATSPVLYATVGLGGQAQRQGGATVTVTR